MIAWRKVLLLEQKDAYEALLWIGMKGKEIGEYIEIQQIMFNAIDGSYVKPRSSNEDTKGSMSIDSSPAVKSSGD